MHLYASACALLHISRLGMLFAQICGLQGSMTKEQKDAGLASVYKRDDGQKRKETDARMREAAFVPDAYGECYPGYHELGTAVVDDDEADFTAMDSKVNRPFVCNWTRSCKFARS